jgi:hypothetical protein
MMRRIRRIVTTNDEHGRSRILFDAHATQTITVLTELWLTDGTPASNSGQHDNAILSTRLEPPRSGTVFRYFEIAPEVENTNLPLEERYQRARDWFKAMGGSHLQVDTSRHQSMHRSNSTDYIILLQGEITLVLDEDEVNLEPFDAVIQRGTNHA